MTRIGYVKLGRSMPLDPADWGVVGGDDEPPLLLKDLAERNPSTDWVLIGRNSGEDPTSLGYPPTVTNPWTEWRKEMRGLTVEQFVAWSDRTTLPVFRELDGVVVWSGQHCTSHFPIAPDKGGWGDKLTSPYEMCQRYGSYVTRGLNAWRLQDPLAREEVWLHPDPRNYTKARDLKWPNRHPMLGQFEFNRETKHERFGDPKYPAEYGFDGVRMPNDHTWIAPQRYTYSRLEICGVMPWHIDSTFSTDYGRSHFFGLFINEAKKETIRSRLKAMQEWILPNEPDWVHGKWSPESLKTMGRDIAPAPAEDYYPLLRSTLCTMTTPSSGSGWATTKPWQAFAVGTVCFFHPDYDTQNNILGDAPQALQDWLRVKTPDELKARLSVMLHEPQAWHDVVTLQRDHYDKAVREARHLRLIEERLCLSQ